MLSTTIHGMLLNENKRGFWKKKIILHPRCRHVVVVVVVVVIISFIHGYNNNTTSPLFLYVCMYYIYISKYILYIFLYLILLRYGIHTAATESALKRMFINVLLYTIYVGSCNVFFVI